MAGSIFGRQFCVSTWGESHGKAVGVVVDGCPAGLSLSEDDIQIYLDRRRPGKGKLSSLRKEDDKVNILSGVFENKTTGTPISMLVWNKDHRSTDYSSIKDIFRPGHADYTFQEKYGFRDYRGGGRSSGRETVARVAAGAVAAKMLGQMGITVKAEAEMIAGHPAEEAEERMKSFIEEMDSAGGTVVCRINNLPVGLGETVFDKLDANLAKAMLSIGAVKGFEIGDGFAAAVSRGSENNDSFYISDGKIKKRTNHSGGVLGGMSDGDEVFFRVAIKPTPSIAKKQETVSQRGEEARIMIHGRHDPVIVPRAVVVVETMAALVVSDLLLINMTSRMDYLQRIYGKL